MSIYVHGDLSYTDPWRTHDTVVFIHGNAESGEAWYAWVPYFSRRFQILRLDLPGFGKSPTLGDAPLTLAGLNGSALRVLDSMQIDSAHFVCAKFGGAVGISLAAEYPERVKTLSLLGVPVSASRAGGSIRPGAAAKIGAMGLSAWARATMAERLGTDASPQQIEWWATLMSSSDERTCLEASMLLANVEFESTLHSIEAPTLIVSAQDSPMVSEDAAGTWASLLPNGHLITIPGDGYHVAAASPDSCARHVLSFIDAHSGAAGEN
jgi:pimeloyl-ACP methyl ester carboxylesterase